MTDACVFRLIEDHGRVAITAVVHVDDIFAVGQKERCDRLCVRGKQCFRWDSRLQIQSACRPSEHPAVRDYIYIIFLSIKEGHRLQRQNISMTFIRDPQWVNNICGSMTSKRCRQKKGNQIGIYKFKETYIMVIGDMGNWDKINNVLVKGDKEVRVGVNKSYPVDPYSCYSMCHTSC